MVFSRSAALALAVTAAASAADAATWQTVFDFSPVTVGVVTADQVIFDYEFSVDSGTATATQLLNWTISILGGGSLLYADNVVLAGIAQSINGHDRAAGSFTQGYHLTVDLDAGQVLFFDNFYATGGFEAVHGAKGDLNVFNDFSGDREIYLNNGTLNDYAEAVQTTREVSAVPLPAGGLLLLSALGAIALGRRRAVHRER